MTTMALLADVTVAEAMVRHPKVHGAATTLGEVRRILTDDHVHAVLIVAGRRLVTVIERVDLNRASGADPDSAAGDDDQPAVSLGRLTGRVVAPAASAADTLRAMTSAGRRRLAVVDNDGALLGLLCLKRRGNGFCSDDDVRARRLDSR
ncbi:CBS domain-containing protein [Frankia sp. AgKG'84/4]|uniref:CBS domain-containing protein n=1 Tax=Frankia sp. AgKG'84/4 TaxID=573490 RepID=UPI00200F46BE|nr:CBS domain-containing protein [Frankia sp. AgKG'84/4]MCL9793372.1 CBS domain-containing protein [Frankia sp. AgKG'84/4]